MTRSGSHRGRERPISGISCRSDRVRERVIAAPKPATCAGPSRGCRPDRRHRGRNPLRPAGAGGRAALPGAVRRTGRRRWLPVGAAGRITTPEGADAVVRKGRADLAVVGRQHFRDPYFVVRAAEALGLRGARPAAVPAWVRLSRAATRSRETAPGPPSEPGSGTRTLPPSTAPRSPCRWCRWRRRLPLAPPRGRSSRIHRGSSPR